MVEKLLLKIRIGSLICFLIFFFFSHLSVKAESKIGRLKIDSIPFLKKNPKKMELVKKLLKTNLKNGHTIYKELKLDQENKGTFNLMGRLKYVNGVGFKTKNPYFPRYVERYKTLNNLKYPLPKNILEYELDKKRKTIRYYNQEVITKWFSNLKSDNSVCAFKFLGNNERDYKLKSFKNIKEAKMAGYKVTHRYKCGTCSSLKDLAIYIAMPDLTDPVRNCSKKLTLNMTKKCLMRDVGFSEYCLESWTYNGDHTKKRCIGTCIKQYGLINLITNNMQGANVDKDGKLKPCIACDEFKSGPGFKYTAARTRRWSGLKSAIPRSKDEIFQVNHFENFQEMKNWKWFD